MGSSVFDKDLTPLLRSCSDEDLIPLRDYILAASTNELAFQPAYKAQPNQPSKYVDDLVYEIRTFGGNTLANMFRPAGVPYAEVARDVAKRLKADLKPGASVPEVEWAILTKVLEKAIEEMSPEERAKLEDMFREAGFDNINLGAGIPIGLIMAQIGVRMSGFLAYQLAVIVANAVARAVLGRGLSLAANAALTRSLAVFAGPVGWVITGLWTLVDIAGPAYRVTLPCVCHVAYLRVKHQFSELELPEKP